MKRVLIATDDRTFNVSLASAYLARGWSVDVGLAAFWMDLKVYDLIHFHWPEELTGWVAAPRPEQVQRVLERLDVWASKSQLICTVHNLLPHAALGGDGATDYYRAFYDRMQRIGHFSETSRAEVRQLFPKSVADRHIVHGMNDFRDLRIHAVGREAARASLGLANNSFVIATFGQLRTEAELTLAVQAIDLAEVNSKEILFASRRPPPQGRLRKLWKERQFAAWARRQNVILSGHYMSDADSVAVFEASDAILILRRRGHLNSGLLPLAMTFGTPLVAPDFGIFAETLKGTPNEFYEPGDASSMAKAIRRLAQKSTVRVREANQAIAADWGWPSALGRLLHGIEPVKGRIV